MNAGIVLCGGRSLRMGRPKAWLPFAGEPMLSRIVRLVGEAVDHVILVAAPDQDVPPVEARIVRDDAEGRGPLNGFIAGLSALPDSIDAVFLTSCDVPLLKPEIVRLMLDSLGSHDAAIPVIGSVPQPLLAAYRVPGLLERAKRLLAEGRGGVVHLLAELDVQSVQESDLRRVDPELGSLRNVNTPEEYEALNEPDA